MQGHEFVIVLVSVVGSLDRDGRGRIVESVLNGRRVLKVELSGFADRSVQKGRMQVKEYSKYFSN